MLLSMSTKFFGCLRNSELFRPLEAQAILGELMRCQQVHLIATVDKLNGIMGEGPLSFVSNSVCQFSFLVTLYPPTTCSIDPRSVA